MACKPFVRQLLLIRVTTSNNGDLDEKDNVKPHDPSNDRDWLNYGILD